MHEEEHQPRRKKKKKKKKKRALYNASCRFLLSAWTKRWVVRHSYEMMTMMMMMMTFLGRIGRENCIIEPLSLRETKKICE